MTCVEGICAVSILLAFHFAHVAIVVNVYTYDFLLSHFLRKSYCYCNITSIEVADYLTV